MSSSARQPLSSLPIDEVLSRIASSLVEKSNLVLTAPPGAGKSTRVPPALLLDVLPKLQSAQSSVNTSRDSQRIILLQPRRLAARSVASRIADEQGWTLSREVGYHVRFERKFSRETKLLVMTDGMFLRHLQTSPWLDDVAAVLFDEFHERSLNNDLALALCRRIQQEVRPELRLVVMSATLAAEPVARFLDHCTTVESLGRTFPVEIQHARFADSRPITKRVVEQIVAQLPNLNGDLLVFLPGLGEIRQVARDIEPYLNSTEEQLLELFGEMPLDQQSHVLAPSNRRKIILATNVAETSITIPGVTAVIDSGAARIMRQDSSTGLNRLEVERISKASAAQRAGRAGRTAPGTCVRLWSESEQRGLADFDSPEIRRVDLSGAILELLAWGEPDPREFPWYEAPTEEAMTFALTLLHRLGAIDEQNRITPLGKRMVQLPLQSRIARLLIAGQDVGLIEHAALLAALLSERDPFSRNERGTQSRANRHFSRRAQHHTNSDLLDRLDALLEWESTKANDTWLGRVSTQGARSVLRVRDQLLQQLRERNDQLSQKQRALHETLDDTTETELLKLVLAAFPDRVARRREPKGNRAVMVGGRGVRLVDESAVRDAEWFVCVELIEAGGNESLVRAASAIEPEWLDQKLIRETTDLRFDQARDRVVQLRRTCYEDVILKEVQVNLAPDQLEEASTIIANEILNRGTDERQKFLQLNESAQNYLARWESLSVWFPDLELPTIDDVFREKLIRDLCSGCTSLGEVRNQPILHILKNQLTHTQQQAIEREAPERITVPSGSKIVLEYASSKAPILAVRVQELFGMADTPRIARGRVKVLLHLLGPNYRPQQVTEDLASFWRNTYPEVKKELKRRYPKHSWPDDPLTAQAVNKGGRRN
jgi:ATP-dependent helicase HrpB